MGAADSVVDSRGDSAIHRPSFFQSETNEQTMACNYFIPMRIRVSQGGASIEVSLAGNRREINFRD
jgi:hypothetical protein